MKTITKTIVIFLIFVFTGFGLIELWSKRYADSNIDIGAGTFIFFVLLIMLILAILFSGLVNNKDNQNEH